MGRAARAPRVDGRRLRSTRTRAAILEALLALVRDGRVVPTAPQIAARAGVSLRTVAQHFPTRDDLFAAAATAYREIAPRTDVVDVAAPLATRIATFAGLRAEVLEVTAPYRLTATTMAAQSPAVADGLRKASRRRRAEVAAAFAPELGALPDRARIELLDGLDVVAGGRTWDALRQDLRLGPRVAQARLELLLGAVLAAAR
ncbi:MAG: TetR family transcriptional regulator [Kofleriaceae bacterium]|nr:TetR family transcriptional regulator [Kofleriaceae bacterium]